jgi:acetylornithine deacetylase/succinyl-diaminopimelate desuccinylase-like protein
VSITSLKGILLREQTSLIDFYRELIRIPSIWGHAQPLRRAADLIGDVLSSVGHEVALQDSGTERMPMVIAQREADGGRSVVFNGHMEVYPPSESWSMDPFEGVIADGKIFGQGAADMKGGTAAMTMACWILAKYDLVPAGAIKLLAIPNHFEGGEGTRNALGSGLSADFAINCEPSGLLVLTGQRGILYADVAVAGRAAHTTALDIGVNAISRAAKVVTALEGLTPRDANGNPIDDVYIMNVAMISGGIAHNLIPEKCVLTIDTRFTPEQSVETVLRDMEAALAPVREDGLPITISVEETCKRNPRSSFRISEDHVLVRTLAAAHEASGGGAAAYGFHRAWPDTPIFNEMGIPAVTYGPGSMECYWDDEYVDIADYLTAIETYCLAATRLLASPGES